MLKCQDYQEYSRKKNVGKKFIDNNNNNKNNKTSLSKEQFVPKARSTYSKKLNNNLELFQSFEQSDSEYIILGITLLKKVLSGVADCQNCSSKISVTHSKNVDLASEVTFSYENCVNRPSKKYFTS